MKNLFIPPLGTEIELAAPWEFPLYDEYRNSTLFDFLGFKMKGYSQKMRSVDAKLPIGTGLKIDRIYIRKGQNDFASVTFQLTYMDDEQVKKVRFWAKLEDVNKIKIKD